MERHIFDENQPTGSMSLENLRNVLRALFQGDFMPLRPRASMVLDDMEYPSDVGAQDVWSGDGVTVGYSTTKQEGNYALELTIDGTGDREAKRSKNIDLSGFVSIKLWERVDVASSAFKFFIEDGDGNQSYWDITSNGTLSTWQQDTLTLASPDGNNGTEADLSNISAFGFQGLDASKTYIIDTIKAICGLTVAVSPASIASFFAPVYIGSAHLSFLGGPSPVITPPSANPRIDILSIDSTGTLAWTTGTEAGNPVAPTYPAGKIPICLVYCKTTMTKVVDYEEAAANPNEAYIYQDVRPLYLLASVALINLSDCPSSYSGKAGKSARVNSGESAIEFTNPIMLEDADGDTKVQVEEGADDDILRVDVGGEEQVTVQDGKIEPSTDNDIDLGSSSKEFKDLRINGKAYIDQLGENLDCDQKQLIAAVIENRTSDPGSPAAGQIWLRTDV
jgi:hypothetical protein